VNGTFYYNSSGGGRRLLPERIVSDLRAYLVAKDLGQHTTKGELHDALLAFRDHRGRRLMIHQLEPVFTYCAMHGSLWPATEPEMAK
jgi:hypothetical protein